MLKHPVIMDFHIEDPRWRHIPHICAKLEAAAVSTLQQLPKALRFPCTVTLLLTKDTGIKRLNRDFRGIDKPTNVLSFPQFRPEELPKIGRNGEPVHIGDIAISYQYIVAEAENDHKILINHVVHLLIHGILHLFGYDHMAGAEAIRMERLEKKVMAGLGLPDPYAPPGKAPKAARSQKSRTTRKVSRKSKR
jgi:probable rRNA maturation factor